MFAVQVNHDVYEVKNWGEYVLTYMRNKTFTWSAIDARLSRWSWWSWWATVVFITVALITNLTRYTRSSECGDYHFVAVFTPAKEIVQITFIE